MLSLRDVCILVIIQSSLVLPMKILQDSSDKLVKKQDLFYRLIKRELNCGAYIGEYPAEQHCCKKCKKGTFVESDCNVPHGEPVCQICIDGVDFMDEDSGSTECHKCQPCESATGHEMLHKCTVSQNTVCKCKDGFFCSDGLSPNGNCNRCSHCKECAHGVAEQCTSTKDTVCQDFHVILWPVLAVVVLALIIIGGVIYYKKRREKKQISEDPAPPGENDVNVQLIHHKPKCPPELENIHLENHLYDISGLMAEESVLKLVLKKMSSVDLENIKKDHQNDTSERKYELLKKWYTQNGRQGAFKTLWEGATKREVERIIELPDIVSLLGTHVPIAI